MINRPSLRRLMASPADTPIFASVSRPVTPLPQRFARATLLVLAVTVLYLALPLGSHAVPPVASHGSLSVRVQSLAARIDELQGKIDKLQRRENVVQADLTQKQARAQAIGQDLDATRIKLAKARKRLAHARKVLSARLVGIYRTGRPDIISVVLRSNGFADLVETADFYKRIANQDHRVISRVITLRQVTKTQTIRLAALESQAQVAVAQVQNRRDEIAGAKTRLAVQVGPLSASLRKTRRQLAVMAANSQERDASGAPTVTTFGQSQPAPLNSSGRVILRSDGSASAPSSAPSAIKAAVAAGNQIRNTPYLWGGGHGSFSSSGYDCSGSVSYVLHGAGVLSSPLASGPLESWGAPGPGKWITVYANAGHTFMSVGGVWFDTSGRGANGSRWQGGSKSTGGYVVRHPPGL